VPIDQSCPFWASDLESAISHPKKKPRKSGKKEPNRNYCTTLNEQTGRWRNVNDRVTKVVPTSTLITKTALEIINDVYST
jgi:hypothetical protein